MNPKVLSSSSIEGTSIRNATGEDLGNIKDLMINLKKGNVAYAVVSFGGFLGFGDKYFAIPWEAFHVDSQEEKFVLNVPKDKLENAPGFEKDNWPTTALHDYLTNVYKHYGYSPNWN